MGLDGLLDAARASGVQGRLEISGVQVIVGPLVERTAYRIVQEALTNVLRHGMRERVCSAGGTLSTGPGPRSGFAVVASLPTVPRRCG